MPVCSNRTVARGTAPATVPPVLTSITPDRHAVADQDLGHPVVERS